MKFDIKKELTFFYNRITRDVTFFGTWVFVFFAVLLFLVINEKVFAIQFAFATVVFGVLEVLIKLFYKTKRPDYNKHTIMSLYDSFEEHASFPSGHSGKIAIFATLIYFHYAEFALTTFAVILALLVGISRVSLSRHYKKDVLGGYVLGFLVGLLFVIL